MKQPTLKVRIPALGEERYGERYKGAKVRVFGTVVWVEPGPGFILKEPRPARPIPEQDRS